MTTASSTAFGGRLRPVFAAALSRSKLGDEPLQSVRGDEVEDFRATATIPMMLAEWNKKPFRNPKPAP
ncbi:hypothetical protein JFU49_04995 [Pseudomonas sp. TH03]|uniref:hypothetical protein n=1 Tax=Pseudomonas sp. TH03 TaxID=2796369 RepID=UPI00191390E4|nr:hypothetical protein [Pseudomonas sp. TH03]MBK5549644.1 hypothetical protein [Pseudomonas sp. TH03]